MLPLTLSSVRRLSPPLRLRLQVAYARAWEALTDTHQTQAVMFVRRLADRLTLEDALQRYFRQVAVPVGTTRWPAVVVLTSDFATHSK